MSKIAESEEEDEMEDEESFKNFPQLPPELRMMIVDEMRTDDRCRFAACSKLSNAEAKYSKKYIESLEFRIISEDEVTITDRHDKSDEYCEKVYFFEFGNYDECNYISYNERSFYPKNKELRIRRIERELWMEELDDSMSIIQHAVQHFKELLQKYQHAIKKLSLYSSRSSSNDEFDIDFDFDMEITRLSNLEELHVNGEFNSVQFLSKTKYPLKKLSISKHEYNEFPMKKIYQVQQYLSIEGLELNNDQFLQLSASNISIHIGQLTEEDISEFIKSWQNGSIGRELGSYSWDLRESIFNLNHFFRLFGNYEFDPDAERNEIRIKHDKKDGSFASICGFINSFHVYFHNV